MRRRRRQQHNAGSALGPGLVWNLADIALLAGTLLATWVLLRPNANAALIQET